MGETAATGERAGADEDLAGRADSEAVVRLSPAVRGAGALTVAFTRFPGVLVRFGDRHVEAYPQCGCDACDEQPDDLLARVRGQIELFVTGGFCENSRDRHSSWAPWAPRQPLGPGEARGA